MAQAGWSYGGLVPGADVGAAIVGRDAAGDIKAKLHPDGTFERTGAATFTQTFATADATLSAYTADVESSAYTGIDNAQGGSVYATLTDLNALRVAYENLRAFTEDLAKFTNKLVDELQTAKIVK